MKPGMHSITTISVENYTQANDFAILVEQALPATLRTWIGGDDLPSLPILSKPMFADIAIRVEHELFRCHKVFFCGRSDFFKAMISDHFLEHEETGDLPIYTLRNITLEAFRSLLSYLYVNHANFALGSVYEMLMLSDLYLLPGLKKQAALFVGQHLELSNVIDVIRLARLFELSRLEMQCTEFLAEHLYQALKMVDWHELIQEDAKDVIGRQETDSIDVVDNVRYHIKKNVKTMAETEEADHKLRLIDDLLDQLDLVA